MTDIIARAERREDGKWTTILGIYLFEHRDYGLFSFLAGVSNDSGITPISKPRGLPDDIAQDEDPWLGEHSHSWLSIDELLAFDYDQKVEDCRVFGHFSKNSWIPAHAAEPGYGETTTYWRFLGREFFQDLLELKNSGAERIIFGFVGD